MPGALPRRSEIDPRYTWDLTNIHANDEAFEADRKHLEEELPKLQSFRSHLGDSAKKLCEWFQAYEPVFIRARHIFTYGGLRLDTDMSDQHATALRDTSRTDFTNFAAAVAFAEPEILAISKDTLDQFIKEEPALEPYRHYFDILKAQEGHVRSAEVESVLALAGDALDASRSAHSALADADLKYGHVHTEEGDLEVAASTLGALQHSSDIKVRKAAWEQYADGYLSVKNTFASTISGGIKKDIFYARARNYGSSLDAALKRNHIPLKVYENMLDTARRKLPVWHRYWSVRRRILGLDMLHAYDVFAPLTKDSPAIKFEEGVDMICEGMQPLGDEYVQPMRRGLLQDRWVDVYPNQGKRSGAYSSGAYGTNPFIFMGYNDSLNDVSTLAHELGHSMHSYLSRKNQPVLYSHYSMFVAETASNFNQAMVRAHLLQTRDDRQFQLAIIEEAMYNFHRYFFVMPILARFEREIHERVERGEALTADGMTTRMAAMFAEAYGPEVEVDEARVGITWAQFPIHMYANF